MREISFFNIYNYGKRDGEEKTISWGLVLNKGIVMHMCMDLSLIRFEYE